MESQSETNHQTPEANSGAADFDEQIPLVESLKRSAATVDYGENNDGHLFHVEKKPRLLNATPRNLESSTAIELDAEVFARTLKEHGITALQTQMVQHELGHGDIQHNVLDDELGHLEVALESLDPSMHYHQHQDQQDGTEPIDPNLSDLEPHLHTHNQHNDDGLGGLNEQDQIALLKKMAHDVDFNAHAVLNADGLDAFDRLQSVFNENQAAQVKLSMQSPAQIMRTNSLTLVDNVSGQILTILSKGPHSETLNIVTRPDTEAGSVYRQLTVLFDQIKAVYECEAFLDADVLDLSAPEFRATIRKANLATFLSSVFGSVAVGFFHLNENFLHTFVPDGAKLLKAQGALYLDLKTQAYISAMGQGERSQEEILEDLFPEEVERHLSQRKGGKALNAAELEFVARCKARREHLATTSESETLTEKYEWHTFLKDVAEYVARNHENITAQPARKARTKSQRLTDVHHLLPAKIQPTTEMSIADQAELHELQQLQDSLNNGDSNDGDLDLDNMDPDLFDPEMHVRLLENEDGSITTQQLYERARQASRPSPSRRGKPAQRRPWTKEEEQALFAGLDSVKGPHWSEILSLYGPGGSISEALKDRNQVQLKDKARNLKLFFLKVGILILYQRY